MSAILFQVGPAGLESLGAAENLVKAGEDLPPGAYTTLRTYGGRRILRLEDHVARLVDSAAQEGAPGGLDEDAVRQALGRAVSRAGFKESRLRLTFSPPQLFVAIEPFVPIGEELYRVGARCVTVGLRRERPHSKGTSFSAEAAEAYRRLPPGIHEGLLVSEDGVILEGLSSNVFVLKDGILWTEERRALEGVTRSLVIEAAEGAAEVRREGPRLVDLAAFQEAFLTSTSRGVLSVVRIDGQTVGDGTPGPLGAELSRRLLALVEKEAEALP